jgi:hypothetical protein
MCFRESEFYYIDWIKPDDDDDDTTTTTTNDNNNNNNNNNKEWKALVVAGTKLGD